jgi:hypothetical protein
MFERIQGCHCGRTYGSSATVDYLDLCTVNRFVRSNFAVDCLLMKSSTSVIGTYPSCHRRGRTRPTHQRVALASASAVLRTASRQRQHIESAAAEKLVAVFLPDPSEGDGDKS